MKLQRVHGDLRMICLPIAATARASYYAPHAVALTGTRDQKARDLARTLKRGTGPLREP